MNQQDNDRFEQTWLAVDTYVPGWCTKPDARLLYEFAAYGPTDGAIVEIGSAWGRSTVFLARGSSSVGREKVYSIDPHTGDPWFLRNIGPPPPNINSPFYHQRPGSSFSSRDGFLHTIAHFGIEEYVVPVVKAAVPASYELNTGPIRLLFIDGLHYYEAVRADIEAWVPRVVRGGVIIFDDYYNTREDVGVRRAVDELLSTGSVAPLHEGGRRTVWTMRL